MCKNPKTSLIKIKKLFKLKKSFSRKQITFVMTAIRVLVGTKKGAFILTSDAKRAKWEVNGPFFAGWEVYHMKGSPADPDRIYASQSSGWFGQIVQRSDDGGKTWFQPGFKLGDPTTTSEGMPVTESNKFAYNTTDKGKPLTTHQWYDGTQHPWEFKRVWHMEPSISDVNTVYAGAEDAAIDRGKHRDFLCLTLDMRRPGSTEYNSCFQLLVITKAPQKFGLAYLFLTTF